MWPCRDNEMHDTISAVNKYIGQGEYDCQRFNAEDFYVKSVCEKKFTTFASRLQYMMILFVQAKKTGQPSFEVYNGDSNGRNDPANRFIPRNPKTKVYP